MGESRYSRVVFQIIVITHNSSSKLFWKTNQSLLFWGVGQPLSLVKGQPRTHRILLRDNPLWRLDLVNFKPIQTFSKRWMSKLNQSEAAKLVHGCSHGPRRKPPKKIRLLRMFRYVQVNLRVSSDCKPHAHGALTGRAIMELQDPHPGGESKGDGSLRLYSNRPQKRSQ